VIDLAGTPVVIQNVHVVPPADVSLFREQRAQVAELAAIAKSEDRPLVMAGDFNATANSRLVTKLLDDGMRDANAVAGSGLSHTWPDIGPLRFLPGIRIDHVLTSSNIRVHEHLVGPSIGSDHRPLFVCISMQ
jgi:endonuclease/exonuclease/phosphatase (EEP) superfamily protein YafD